jgi:endoglucanase
MNLIRMFVIRYIGLGLVLGIAISSILLMKDQQSNGSNTSTANLNGFDVGLYPQSTNASNYGASSGARSGADMTLREPQALAKNPSTSDGLALSNQALPANDLQQSPFYVRPGTQALSTAAQWANSRAADARIMQRIGQTPTAQWFGGWNSQIATDVDHFVTSAKVSAKIPILVVYNIPNRDCGSYSAGGASASGYSSWIRSFASGLSNRPAVIIVEPDALAQITCLTSSDQTARYAMLADAVKVLKTDSSAKVYVDAGHAGWIDPAEMANRLQRAGIESADGISLNVSNFTSTQSNVAYGHAILSHFAAKHMVVDTSRNGQGGTAGAQWCNPLQQSLGSAPTTATNDPIVDAYLWIKTPGESDGTCNGGPAAGQWWPEYALNLGKKAGY